MVGGARIELATSAVCTLLRILPQDKGGIIASLPKAKTLV